MKSSRGSPATALETLVAIRDPDARARAVAGRRARLGDATFASALGELARRAAQGDATARDAVLVCARWLLSPERASAYREVLASAMASEDALGRALFEEDEHVAHKRLPARARLLDPGGPNCIVNDRRVWVPRFVRGSPGLSAFFPLDVARTVLGDAFTAATELVWTRASEAWDEERAGRQLEDEVDEAHWETRRRFPADIAADLRRLGTRPTPNAVRAVLTQRPSSVDRAQLERVVLAIGARRPTTPSIVEELVASHWIGHVALRSAIVENPFTPLRVALLLAPTAPLRSIAGRKSNVHPRLQELAGRLLERAAR